jgi:hypothetical protein
MFETFLKKNRNYSRRERKTKKTAVFNLLN